MEHDRRANRGWLLVAAAALIGGTTMFAVVAGVTTAGDPPGFDVAVLRAMRSADDPARPIGPVWLPELMRDLTALGSFGVVAVILLCISGYLLIVGRRREAGLIWVAVIGGAIASSLLKALFLRPRPDVVPALTAVSSTSFPSGHSMISAVAYLTLGTLAVHLEPDLRFRVYFLALAIVLTFVVGLSRVYLGVHYPTDVLAGWSAGLAYAGAWWLGLSWWAGRGDRGAV